MKHSTEKSIQFLKNQIISYKQSAMLISKDLEAYNILKEKYSDLELIAYGDDSCDFISPSLKEGSLFLKDLKILAQRWNTAFYNPFFFYKKPEIVDNQKYYIYSGMKYKYIENYKNYIVESKYVNGNCVLKINDFSHLPKDKVKRIEKALHDFFMYKHQNVFILDESSYNYEKYMNYLVFA